MNMIRLRAGLLATVSIGLWMAASAPFAQGLGNAKQFAMEMKMTSNQGEMAGRSMTMKYYAGKNRLRMEMNMGGMGEGGGMLVERDGDEVTTYMLVPQMKQYMRSVSTYAEYLEEGEGPMFGSPDDANHPCQSDPDMTCDKVGTDSFLGRSVVMYRVTEIEDGAPTESLYWFDPELSFPLKVEGDDGTMEATSVDIGTQPADLFELPAGWTEMQMDY